MKVPKAVRIHGQWISINYKDAIVFEDDEAAGLFHPYSMSIDINLEFDFKTQMRTIIHEVIHAAFEKSTIGQFYTSKQEEAICLLLEGVFADLMIFDVNSNHIRWGEVA